VGWSALPSWCVQQFQLYVAMAGWQLDMLHGGLPEVSLASSGCRRRYTRYTVLHLVVRWSIHWWLHSTVCFIAQLSLQCVWMCVQCG
jgi:hypothetical protein